MLQHLLLLNILSFVRSTTTKLSDTLSEQHRVRNSLAHAAFAEGAGVNFVADHKYTSHFVGGSNSDPASLEEYCAGETLQEHLSHFKLGTRVMCNWEEYGAYYSGVIVAENADGTFRVHYDDGFDEDKVYASQVRPMTEDEFRRAGGKIKSRDDPACKFQDVVKSVEPEVNELETEMSHYLLSERARMAGKEKKPSLRGDVASDMDAKPSSQSTQQDEEKPGAASASAAAEDEEHLYLFSYTQEENEKVPLSKHLETERLKRGIKQEVWKDVLVVKGRDGREIDAPMDAEVPKEKFPVSVHLSLHPLKPVAVSENIENMKLEVVDNHQKIDNLKNTEQGIDQKLRAFTPADKPTPPPGAKTETDLARDLADRIDAQKEEIERRRQHIASKEIELARLGGTDATLEDIHKHVEVLDSKVKDVQAEMERLDEEGELDAELKHILDGIVEPIKEVREQTEALMENEAKSQKDEEKKKANIQAAGDAARKEAMDKGKDPDSAAAKATATAKAQAEESIREEEMEAITEAIQVQTDLRKVRTETEELDSGLHPHGAKWWRFRFEHSYMEAWLMIWISILMLCYRKLVQEFKLALEAWSQPPEPLGDDMSMDHVVTNWSRSRLGADKAGRDDGSLYMVWFSCLAEMMLTCILVFVTIWILCKTSLVDILPWLVRMSMFGEESMHLPQTGDQYRELAMDCSSIYFFAILFYFLLMLPAARDAKNLVHKIATGFTDAAPTGRSDASSLLESGRDVAAASVMGTLARGKTEFGKDEEWFVLYMNEQSEAMKMRPEPEAEELVGLLGNDWSNFKVSRYLIMNVHANMAAMFEFQWKLWLPVVVCFLIFAIIHRFMHIGFPQIMIFFTAVALVIIIAMASYTSSISKFLHQDRTQIAKEYADSIHTRMNTEMLVVKCLQFTMFFLSYGCARMIVQPWMWELHRWLVLSLTCIALLIAIAFIVLVSPALSSFCAVMALPPYVNSENLKLMVRVAKDT